MAEAYHNFLAGRMNAELLMIIHDRVAGRGPGRPSDWYEVLKRSAVILSITAWETYVEDKLSELLRARLASAATPDEMKSAFSSAAHEWLEAKKHKPSDLAAWSGDRWKRLVRQQFERQLTLFNTPNTKNIRSVSRRFLGADLTRAWAWPGTDAQTAGQRLDRLVILRGDLVHRAPDFSAAYSVKKAQAKAAISLVTRLVKCTEAKYPSP